MRSWIALTSEGAGSLSRSCPQQLGGLARLQGGERDLVPAPAPAELVPDAPQHVVAGQAVRAVGGHEQQRQPGQRLGERGKKLERRVVGPLEVVEHHDQRLVPAGGLLEGTAQTLEQRRSVAGLRGRPQLGQEQCQMRLEGATAVEAVRVRAQVCA